MRITWLGHAAWLIEAGGKRVLIDPFITGNPSSPVKASDLEKIDLILVTHNHSDHLGDTVEISNRTGAKVVSMFENVNLMCSNGLKQDHGFGMNKGGDFVDLEGIKVALVQAVHSGNECGVVLNIDGKTVYHAGDTAFFSDMGLIGSQFEIDIALLPIGGYFTMGPKQATEAAKAVKAKIVMPMHYNTFPPIRQDPGAFVKMLSGQKGLVPVPGKPIEL